MCYNTFVAILDLVISFLWIVLLLYWIFSAIGVKKSIRSSSWWHGGLIRVVILTVILLIYQVANSYWSFHSQTFSFNLFGAVIGVIFCFFGMSLAIWARVYLGRNWGMPMSLREKPELVITGPYTFVRHPIYTGLLLAMLGSALAIGYVWVIPLIFLCIYFLFSLKIEEKHMIQIFSKKYLEYKKRTSALIPFVY